MSAYFRLSGCLMLVVGMVISWTQVPQARADTVEVTIANFAFVPDSQTIGIGTTVKWTNQDSDPHTATDVQKAFSSPVLTKGQSYSFTFSKAGVYSYYCVIHAYMRATITVVAGAATDTPLPAPTGGATPPPTSGPPPTLTPQPTSTPPSTSTSTPAPASGPLHLKVSGSLHVGKPADLKVTVTRGGSAVSSMTVTLDARPAGLKTLHQKTNDSGVATFKKVKAHKVGILTVQVGSGATKVTAKVTVKA